MENHRRRVSTERQFTGGHVIEHHPERKQIRARVHFLASSLFGRHVRHRSQQRARRAQQFFRERGLRGDADCFRDRAVLRRQLCQAEIQDLHLAVLRDQYVFRLQVAMHHAFGVRRVQRVGDLDAEFDDLLDFQRLSMDSLPQVRPFQPLHHDERLVLEFDDVVDRADVRVIQRRGGARLSIQAFQGKRVAGKFRGQEFKRHNAPQPRVFSLIDNTHPALAQFREHAVLSNGFADHRGLSAARSEVSSSMLDSSAGA